jgi:hypothetical protein
LFAGQGKQGSSGQCRWTTSRSRPTSAGTLFRAFGRRDGLLATGEARESIRSAQAGLARRVLG